MTADGQPIPAPLLIRYNGEFIPRDVLHHVTDYAGFRDQTDETVLPRLPAGTYEIWALSDPDEEQELIATAGSLREPVRVGLSGGEQAVTFVAPDPETPWRFDSGE